MFDRVGGSVLTFLPDPPPAYPRSPAGSHPPTIPPIRLSNSCEVTSLPNKQPDHLEVEATAVVHVHPGHEPPQLLLGGVVPEGAQAAPEVVLGQHAPALGVRLLLLLR